MDQGVVFASRARAWVIVEDGQPVETHPSRRAARRAAKSVADESNPYASVVIIGVDENGDPIPTRVEIIQHGYDPTAA